MDLVEFHHVDDRPVAFERRSVLLLEPHMSGAGTFVRVGPVEHPRDMHLRENYAEIKAEVTMSSTELFLRDMSDPHQDERVPF